MPEKHSRDVFCVERGWSLQALQRLCEDALGLGVQAFNSVTPSIAPGDCFYPHHVIPGAGACFVDSGGIDYDYSSRKTGTATSAPTHRLLALTPTAETRRLIRSWSRPVSCVAPCLRGGLTSSAPQATVLVLLFTI